MDEEVDNQKQSGNPSFTVDAQGRKHYVLRAETGFYEVNVSDFSVANDRADAARIFIPVVHEFVSQKVAPVELPNLLKRMASFIINADVRETVIGDLCERFASDCFRHGRRKAICLMAEDLLESLTTRIQAWFKD